MLSNSNSLRSFNSRSELELKERSLADLQYTQGDVTPLGCKQKEGAVETLEKRNVTV